MRENLPGQRGGDHVLAKFVDHSETYGPEVIRRFAERIPSVETVVDLGAGRGRDLSIVKAAHPNARLSAIECDPDNARVLSSLVDAVHVLDLERDVLPFEDNSVDLIIANQVLEHTKEVFWIFEQVTRVLKVGGRFLVGVPNVASLHNRVLLTVGVHPTQSKLCSAHVRPFSKRDTLKFVEACFPGGYELEAFAGSQFYPFPAAASRALAMIAPACAFSIFFLFRKRRAYEGGFAAYPARAGLETNFWAGPASL